MASTTDEAKAIRAEYKRRGWNSRMIGVRSHLYSMGSSIYVTIKHPSIPMAAAEHIAEGAENIRRDGYGEILSGGNRYVHVEHSSECRAILASQHLEAVKATLTELPEESNVLLPVDGCNGAEILIGCDGPWRARLWVDGSASQSFNRDDPATGAYAVAITLQTD